MGLKFKIAANTLAQIIGKGITAGVTFLVTIFVARQFGAEGYGEFAKIMSYVAFFYLITDFGFNAIVIKQITDKEGETERFFRNLLGMRLGGSLILVFVALALLSFLPYSPSLNQGFSPLSKLGIVIATFTILTQALFLTANVLFQKNLRYDLSVLASSAGSISTLFFVFAFTSLRASLLLVIVSYAVGGVLMAGLALIFARRFLPQTGPLFDFSLWRKLFWQTLPLGATLVFNLIYFRIDIMILALLRANFEVGVYGLAYKFFEFPVTFVTFFMNSIYPVMLFRAKENNERLKSLIKKLVIFLVPLSLLLTLALILFAPYLTLIKPDFAPSVLALRILSFSLPLFFLSALFMWVLITLGKQKLLAIFYGFSMILNICLNLIFIPRYGYLAAAVITCLTELAIVLLTGTAAFSFLSPAIKES